MGELRLKKTDFVDVFDAEGVKVASVPKAWVGTRLLPKGWSPKGKKAESDSSKYGSLKKAELQEIIAERNLARADEDVLSDEGTNAELVARLEADDDNQA